MVITADLDPANFGSIPNMSFKKTVVTQTRPVLISLRPCEEWRGDVFDLVFYFVKGVCDWLGDAVVVLVVVHFAFFAFTSNHIALARS